MRRPRGLIGWTLACAFAGLLCACDADGVEPPSAGDRAEEESAEAAPLRLTWGPVERIAAGPWGSRAATVMAPDGTATAMWAGPHGAVSREAPPGLPWKPVEEMPHTTNTGNFLAGVDGHGTVTAVWDHDDSRSQRYSFWTAQHPTGGSWSRPIRLGGGPEGDIGWLGWDLAVSASGAAVFAWGPEDGPIRARYRPANDAWTPTTTMPAPTWPLLPLATIDAEGLATVAYLRDNPGRLTLVQASPAGWEEPAKLEKTLGSRPFDIDAAGAGEVVVAWQEPDLRMIAGHFSKGKLTDQHPLTETGEPAVELLVAASDDGSARYVWLPGDPENQAPSEPGEAKPEEVHSVYQSPSGEVSDPEVVGATGPCGTTETYATGLRRNDRGDTVFAWSGTDPSGMDVTYRSAGAEVWSPQDGAVPDGQGPNCWASPTVALAENGTALITWENYHNNLDQFDSTELLARRAIATW